MSLDCDAGKDSNELSGGVGGPLELVDGDDHCLESGGKRLLNSVIVGLNQEFSKEDKKSSEWDKARKRCG